MRKVKRSPSVFLAYANVLKNATAKVFTSKHESRKTIFWTVFVIGLVGDAAFNAAFDRNLFDYCNYNLMQISGQ